MTAIISLDLGFAGEATALAVVEGECLPLELRQNEHDFDGRPADVLCKAIWLERFPPGTSYPDVVARTAGIAGDARLSGAYVLVNCSSSGRAPLSLFHKSNIPAQGFTVVHGQAENWQGQTQAVPKAEMVGGAVVALQTDRLRVAKGLPLAAAFRDELLNFKMRPPRIDTIEARRENPNDDLVFAVALACWWGRRALAEHDLFMRYANASENQEDDTGRSPYTGY